MEWDWDHFHRFNKQVQYIKCYAGLTYTTDLMTSLAGEIVINQAVSPWNKPVCTIVPKITVLALLFIIQRHQSFRCYFLYQPACLGSSIHKFVQAYIQPKYLGKGVGGGARELCSKYGSRTCLNPRRTKVFLAH